MTITRRRFLAIAAAFATSSANARTHSWHGHAFGSDISLSLHGPRRLAEAAITEVRTLITETERRFSLYDPASDIVRLNRTGSIRPHPQFLALMRAADHAHQLTAGLFDPTVQPLWHAEIQGRNPATATHLVGWEHVRVSAEQITLAPGQALTFNGIAQGFATDLVSDWLRDNGFEQTLVNIGEYRGNGGPWRLALEDPTHGVLGTRTLKNSAIATSSPLATPVGARGHILHPHAQPRWSTVAVEADSATLADALSTGLVLAKADLARRIATAVDVHRITLVDQAGDLTTLR